MKIQIIKKTIVLVFIKKTFIQTEKYIHCVKYRYLKLMDDIELKKIHKMQSTEDIWKINHQHKKSTDMSLPSYLSDEISNI